MEQYSNSGTLDVNASIKPVIKTPEQKTIELLEANIKELNGRIDSQYKLVDKLVKDVRKMKDQISDLAGRIPRG